MVPIGPVAWRVLTPEAPAAWRLGRWAPAQFVILAHLRTESVTDVDAVQTGVRRHTH